LLIVRVVVSQVGFAGLATPESVLVKTTFHVTVLPLATVIFVLVLLVLTEVPEAAPLRVFVSGP